MTEPRPLSTQSAVVVSVAPASRAPQTSGRSAWVLRGLLLGMLVGCGTTSTAWAQLPTIQLRTVFPPGGQAGTTVSVEVAEGDDLDELSGLLFSHPGIQLAEQPDPLTNPRKFQVNISKDVPPGYYGVRAQGRFGVSNSRMFRVEAQPAKAVTEAELNQQIPFPVELNSVIYSRIDSAGDLDEFVFELQPDRLYTLTVEALSIDSKLQPAVELFNPQGRRIANARQVEQTDPRLDFRVHEAGAYRVVVSDFMFRGAVNYGYRLQLTDQSPPLSIQAPTPLEGEQVTVLKPVLNENGVEAVTVPLEWQASQTPPALPGFLSPRQVLSDKQLARLRSEELPPEPVAVPVARWPLVESQSTNNSQQEAQPLPVPVEVVGRFSATNLLDVFRFEAKKGDVLWLQVLGERDGQALDPHLLLEQVTVDAEGKETVKPITIPEGVATNLYPNVFDTVTDDIEFELKVPEDTSYRLTVRNRYHLTEGQTPARYRLRIAPPRPDFRVVALNLPQVIAPVTADTPAGVVLRRGGVATCKILLDQQQGFDKGVLVTAPEAPAGLEVTPLLLPPGATSGNLILRATTEAAPGPVELQLEARAVDPNQPDQPLEDYPARSVVPAEVVWKAETVYPAVSRLGHSLVVSVVEESIPLQWTASPPPLAWHVTQGQQIWHPLELTREEAFKDKVTLTVEGLDNNAKIQAALPELTHETPQSPVRITVAADGKEGWHVAQVKLATAFNHVRNPELLTRQEAAFQQKEQNVAAKKEELQATAGKLDAAKKAVEQQQQEVNKLKAEVDGLTKQREELDKQLAEASKQLEAAEEEAAQAEQKKVVDQLTADRDAKMKALVEAQAKHQAAIELAQKNAAEVETLTKAHTDLTTQVANLDKDLAAAKTALDKVRTDQKPKALKHEVFVENLVLHVHKAPLKLTLKSPAEMTIKRGEAAEATVELARVEGVEGPVEFTLTAPPGVQGLTAEGVTLSGEDKSATVKITATADATVGKHAFCTVRGTITHAGHPLSVDLPITITIPE